MVESSHNDIRLVQDDSRFSNVELLVVALSFACCHIVDDGVTPHMIKRIFLADLESRFTNDHADLSFVVDGLSESWMRIYLVSVRDCRGPTFGEDHGMCRYIDFVRAVVAVKGSWSKTLIPRCSRTYPEALNSLACAY